MTDTKAIETHSSDTRRFAPSAAFSERARIRSASEYEKLYRESLDSPETFYRRELGELVFRTPFSTTFEWKPPFAKWFLGATPERDRELPRSTSRHAAREQARARLGKRSRARPGASPTASSRAT